jgi:hypothetical protein
VDIRKSKKILITDLSLAITHGDPLRYECCLSEALTQRFPERDGPLTIRPQSAVLIGKSATEW